MLVEMVLRDVPLADLVEAIRYIFPEDPLPHRLSPQDAARLAEALANYHLKHRYDTLREQRWERVVRILQGYGLPIPDSILASLHPVRPDPEIPILAWVEKGRVAVVATCWASGFYTPLHHALYLVTPEGVKKLGLCLHRKAPLRNAREVLEEARAMGLDSLLAEVLT